MHGMTCHGMHPFKKHPHPPVPILVVNEDGELRRLPRHRPAAPLSHHFALAGARLCREHTQRVGRVSHMLIGACRAEGVAFIKQGGMTNAGVGRVSHIGACGQGLNE